MIKRFNLFLGDRNEPFSPGKRDTTIFMSQYVHNLSIVDVKLSNGFHHSESHQTG